jgi:hypothetical protein
MIRLLEHALCIIKPLLKIELRTLLSPIGTTKIIFPHHENLVQINIVLKPE